MIGQGDEVGGEDVEPGLRVLGGGLAVAAEVGDDDAVAALGEVPGLGPPHGAVEGVAVDQQDRTAGTEVVVGEVHAADVRQSAGSEQYGAM